ncbi:hypothetical protein DMENIID0001_018290 [Sergentomyia squamirostris]
MPDPGSIRAPESGWNGVKGWADWVAVAWLPERWPQAASQMCVMHGSQKALRRPQRDGEFLTRQLQTGVAIAPTREEQEHILRQKEDWVFLLYVGTICTGYYVEIGHCGMEGVGGEQRHQQNS